MNTLAHNQAKEDSVTALDQAFPGGGSSSSRSSGSSGSRCNGSGSSSGSSGNNNNATNRVTPPCLVAEHPHEVFHPGRDRLRHLLREVGALGADDQLLVRAVLVHVVDGAAQHLDEEARQKCIRGINKISPLLLPATQTPARGW